VLSFVKCKFEYFIKLCSNIPLSEAMTEPIAYGIQFIQGFVGPLCLYLVTNHLLDCIGGIMVRSFFAEGRVDSN
jgi:hypothetical protein